MARSCEICGKGTRSGNRVSHAHNITKRKWSVNLQNVRVVRQGRTLQMRVCTRCLRSDRVKKSISRARPANQA